MQEYNIALSAPTHRGHISCGALQGFRAGTGLQRLDIKTHGKKRRLFLKHGQYRLMTNFSKLNTFWIQASLLQTHSFLVDKPQKGNKHPQTEQSPQNHPSKNSPSQNFKFLMHISINVAFSTNYLCFYCLYKGYQPSLCAAGAKQPWSSFI